jgi:NADH-quinone oxidoreductase subunit M
VHEAVQSGFYTGFPWIGALIAIPFVAGVALFFVHDKALRAINIAAICLIDIISVVVLVGFRAGYAGYQFVIDTSWVKAFGISFSLGVDGISLFLVLLVSLIFSLLAVHPSVIVQGKNFSAWLFLLQGACFVSFMALDLFVFFVFFEFSLIPVYFLIARYNKKDGPKAANFFILYTLFGSAFFFVGLLVLVAIHKDQTGVITFSLTALEHTKLSSLQQELLLLAFSIAFFVKTPVFPFHSWSPEAYSKAPTGAAIALAGVMAKLGTYGIIRFDLELFGGACKTLAPLFIALGVIGMLYGAVIAANQKNLARLIAYSSLSHLGFVVLGAFSFVPSALDGSVLQMVNHGIITTGMFLVIAVLLARKKSADLSDLSGLQRPAPILGAVFMIFILAGIGLPGLNGFVGEFLVLSGTFLIHKWWAGIATLVVIFSAVYLLWAYQQGFHGKAKEKISDMSIKEIFIVTPLVLLVGFIGLYPSFLINRIQPSVNQLESHVNHGTSLNYSSSVADRKTGGNKK